MSFNYTCDKLTDGRWLIRIDPSTVQNSNCMRELEMTNLIGLTTKRPDVGMTYGSAMHEVAEALLKNQGVETAMLAGIEYFQRVNPDTSDDWRNISHLAVTSDKYVRRYHKDSFTPLKNDKGAYCVEMPFMIKLLETTIAVYVLVGKMDALGHTNKTLHIQDTKCTKWNAPRDFFEKYRYGTQMKLYSYAVKMMGLCTFYPPVKIDGIFIKNDSSCVHLERSGIIDFQPEHIEEEVSFLLHKCHEIDKSIASGLFLKNATACHRFKKQCPFTRLCWGVPGEIIFEKTKFKQRKYDPNTFGSEMEME